jgi:hypothetical protein
MKSFLLCLSLFISFYAAAMAPTAIPKSKNTKIELHQSLILSNNKIIHSFYHPISKTVHYITETNNTASETAFSFARFIEDKSSVKIEGMAFFNNYILTLFVITHNKEHHSVVLGKYQDTGIDNGLETSPMEKINGKLQKISVAQTPDHDIAITCLLKHAQNLARFRWIISQDYSKGKIKDPYMVKRYKMIQQ